jgi:hypothetical protein
MYRQDRFRIRILPGDFRKKGINTNTEISQTHTGGSNKQRFQVVKYFQQFPVFIYMQKIRLQKRIYKQSGNRGIHEKKFFDHKFLISRHLKKVTVSRFQQ